MKVRALKRGGCPGYRGNHVTSVSAWARGSEEAGVGVGGCGLSVGVATGQRLQVHPGAGEAGVEPPEPPGG